MEQVFYEMGIGSVTELHDFYQSRIVNYHSNTLASCKQLLKEYNKLKEPMKNAVKSPSGSSAVQKDVFNVIR